ncbi:MAG: hypothetical protein H6924_08475 [Alphaproteobacteria bacterium]|nr:hypothetical protein [Alphaproteobacteria bacterium]
MIQKDRLEKIWRKTVLQLLLVLSVGAAILGYWTVVRLQAAGGPSLLEVALAFAALIAAGSLFYLVGRIVKSVIAGTFGKG